MDDQKIKLECQPLLAGMPIKTFEGAPDGFVLVSQKTSELIRKYLEEQSALLLGNLFGMARADEKKRYVFGGEGAHWEGCVETHWDCRIRELEEMVRQLLIKGNSLAEEYREKHNTQGVLWEPMEPSPGLIGWDAQRQIAENLIGGKR